MTYLWTPVRAMLALVLLAGLLVACGGDDDDDADGDATPTLPATAMDDQMGNHATATDGAMDGHDMGDSAEVDPDLLFLDAMIVHHGTALEMSEPAAELAEHEELRQLASDIIAAQRAEIEQMQAWRDEWFPGAPPSDLSGMHDMPGMSMSAEDLDMLREAESFDLMFIDMMIPHHESAVAMASDLQNTTQRPELQDLAAEIIATQQAEIEQMQAWRDAWSSGS